MTYYQVLGIGTAASDDRVRTAYRSRLETLHDDVHDASTAGERRGCLTDLLRIHEAYRSLSDPTRRRAYDGWLALDVAIPDGPRGRCPVCDRVVRLVDPSPADHPTSTLSDAIATAAPGASDPPATVEVVHVERLDDDAA